MGDDGRDPVSDASFDLVWCRDVLEIVADLDAGIAERLARVPRRGGARVVYGVLLSDRLEPKESALLLGQNLALVPSNLVEENVEAAFDRSGLAVALKEVVAAEWREYAAPAAG